MVPSRREETQDDVQRMAAAFAAVARERDAFLRNGHPPREWLAELMKRIAAGMMEAQQLTVEDAFTDVNVYFEGIEPVRRIAMAEELVVALTVGPIDASVEAVA